MPVVSRSTTQATFSAWAIASLVAVGVLAIVTYVAGYSWFRAVLHGGSIAGYLSIFYGLVVIALIALWPVWRAFNTAFSALSMVLLGHLSATASSFVVHILHHDGVESLRNTIAHEGFFGFAFVYLTVSVALGGWFLGPLAALSTTWLRNRLGTNIPIT